MRRERALFAFALSASLALLAGCATGQPGMKKDDANSQKQEAARVHTELGQTYLRQGKLEMAQEKLNTALSFDPDYVNAHTVLAVLYENIGDQAKAEEHYKRAAQLKPKSGAEQNNYGTFLCKVGRYDEAQGYFDRAIADPFYQTPAVALTNSGTCLLHAGKRDEAERRLRLALDKSPNNSETLFQLAAVQYDKGEYFKARAFMQRFESNSQPRPEALMLGRNIELKLGNGSAAGDYTRRLLQGFPESEQARSLSVQGQS
ncbi:MAG TPA: type IV pilus biogenesis/stability protein PilW [Dokdonella sp.]